MSDDFVSHTGKPLADDEILEVIRKGVEQEFGLDAEGMLLEINRFIQSGEPLPDVLRAYFEMAIQQGDLNKAFGRKPGAAINKIERRFRDQAIYNAVRGSGLGLHDEQGGAFEAVGKQYALSAKTVEKIYYAISPKTDSKK